MYILGIYYGHNATAALLKDGKIVGCVSEERFTGIKNFSGLPKKAIDFLLSTNHLHMEAIQKVTLSHTYAVPIHYEKLGGKDANVLVSLLVLLNVPIAFLRNVWGALTMRFPNLRPIGTFFYDLGVSTLGKVSDEKERNYLASYLKMNKEKIFSFDHHLSHAAAAYYTSPFNTERALVLTADGEGDLYSAGVFTFHNKKHRVIAKTRREHSLGYLYAYLTEFLGMKSNEHEYKVMGLAAYAKQEDIENMYEKIQHVVRVDKRNLTFKTSFNTTDGKRYFMKYMQGVRFDLLAGAFQLLLERRIVEWVAACIKRTGISTVVLSGGVFMNVKVNQRVRQIPRVKKLFVLPSCGDESSILGSSFLAFVDSSRKYTFAPIETVYWGKSFTESEIEKVFGKMKTRRKYEVTKILDIEHHIAKLLSRGEIVARLSGSMEFGARALGNRSILADPRNVSVVKVINEKIKNRDFWMPFAATIIKEREGDYLINPKKVDSSFMMMTFDTTEKGRRDLAAAIHQYDETTRPQILREEQNPSYYKIIKAFEKLTGVGAVLNTSFNLHGYPIVLGPKEAIRAFEQSGLTHLAIENYLIIKRRFRTRSS